MEPSIFSILLVDDDPHVLSTMTDIFSVKGFNPIAVGTGRSAMDHIRSQQFDVAVIDLKLEDMTGLDVLRFIKASTPDCECILLTGYATQSSAIEAVNAGAYSFFQKPCDMDQLVLSIQRAAENKQRKHRVQRLLDQQMAINQLALVLGGSLDLQQVYNTIYKHLVNLVEVWCFIISKYDEKEKLIYAEFAASKNEVYDISKFPPIPLGEPGKGTQSRVIHSGQVYYTPDHQAAIRESKVRFTIADDGTVSEEKPSEKDEAETTRSAVYLPMKIAGKVYGILQVQSTHLNGYNDDDINLLSGIANVAAVAIQNARLHEEVLHELVERKQAEASVRHHLVELEVLYETGMSINNLFSPRDVAQQIIQMVQLKLGWNNIAIRLFNPSTQQLELLAFDYPGLNPGNLQEETLRLNAATTHHSHGLFGWVIQIGSSLRCDQVKSHPHYIETSAGTQSGLYVPLKVGERTIGVISIESEEQAAFSEADERLLVTLAAQAGIAFENSRLFEDLQRSNLDLVRAYDDTILGWSQAMELRDKETEGHSERVTNMTLQLARIMGISEVEIEHIRRGALLHDIGKMGVPDSILLKPDRLTDSEWEIMHQHPVFAYDMLSSIEYLRPALVIPRYHHEKWDGSGYPEGLMGEQIPIQARLFAIVDVYDALTSDRPYRPAWTKNKALEYIRQNSGHHFDPIVVEAFITLTSVIENKTNS